MGDDAAASPSNESEAPEEDEPEKGLIRVVRSFWPAYNLTTELSSWSSILIRHPTASRWFRDRCLL